MLCTLPVEQQRDLAIVLRWAPFEERHRVVTAITENHGRISALARNSIQSRRFGGTLEPFTASEWKIVERPGAELFRLEGAELKRSFEGLRKDFQRLALASAWSELMLRVAPEREPCPELFRLHSNALAVLEELPNVVRPGSEIALLTSYMAKILQWGGHQPQIQQCLGCQKPLESLDPNREVTCVVGEAAWLCLVCRDIETGSARHVTRREEQGFQQLFLRVAPVALQDFLLGMTTPIRQVPEHFQARPDQLKGLFAFLEALFVYHLPGFDRTPLKSLRFLDLGPRGASPF